MPIRAINILKSYFLRGAKPTESQFGDLIDSFVHRSDINIGQYKMQIDRENIAISATTNILTSTQNYSLTDTIEVLVNITEDQSFVFKEPSTFVFPYDLMDGDKVTIKKYSIVAA